VYGPIDGRALEGEGRYLDEVEQLVEHGRRLVADVTSEPTVDAVEGRLECISVYVTCAWEQHTKLLSLQSIEIKKHNKFHVNLLRDKRT